MQKIVCRLCALSVVGILGMPLTLSADEFQDALNKANAEFAAQNKQFNKLKTDQNAAWNTLKADQNARWNQYVAEQKAAWDRYSAEIDATWGAAHAKKPTQKEWVAYSPKRDERSSIDFEKGQLQVDVLLKPGESAQSPQVKERIKAQLEQAVAKPAREDPVLEVAPPPSQVAISAPSKPVYPLKDQLTLSNGSEVTPANAIQFAKEVVKNQPLKTKTIQTPQGKKQMVSVFIPLVKDHVQKRARPYLQRVQEMAQRFQIPVSLIFGIMQTESSFNPMSHNGVPAYGLMQLVPRSGARDAYQYVFHDDKLVTANYLYNPDNNIELGSAYLKLLQTREMKRIKDVRSRMFCAIAAYNTGGGNVARAFIPGSHNIRKASAIINRMSFDQVYEHLRTHLPYEETQRYVWKVRKYMKKYTQLDGVQKRGEAFQMTGAVN